MKYVLSVVTFATGALCLALFLNMVRPDGSSPVSEPSRPAYCRLAALWCVGLP
jgi:hypothetical protein